MALFVLALCGCSGTQKEKRLDTRFFFDTVVKLDIECDDETLNEAFELCGYYQKLFDKNDSQSDVYRINSSGGAVAVSKDTAQLVEKALFFSRISGGLFDITLSPVCDLWDFQGTALPDRREIAEALKNVDYGGVKVGENSVDSGGKKIDLGGIAKGYIADRLTEFFAEKGVKKGIVNLGGNISVLGKEKTKIGIAKPFEEQTVLLSVEVSGKSVVTSGIYQRYIEKDGVIYHHILDPKTGFGADTDLASATVIGSCSADCDALATVCILEGSQRAADLIENTDGVEAIFILRDGTINYTGGLYREGNEFFFK